MESDRNQAEQTGILESIGDGLVYGTLVIDTGQIENPKEYVQSLVKQFQGIGCRVHVMPLEGNKYGFSYGLDESRRLKGEQHATM